jgi:glycosidase
MGNPEAVASAYSLFDYAIAADLGGEGAFENLRQRAAARGLRLAGDMVPNHMGIYSRWIVEHPEYFIGLGEPPFPGYAFTGPNLSGDPHVELRIEDGYWTRRDAAVVFQRIDRRNGDVRYIYHGNDGTHLPWNDTAQLDFLRGDVREAVIQTILHVARKFSIIRFDAAMTLTKMHFQRLWFPQPGTGGAIPSRADHGIGKEEFDARIPGEFWREVVDRFRAEMPDTLLLAEAFWLLEGYFVRTLGMHRVYNSAFMHMTMKQENAKFRDMIKSTLAYNPEILKRYVNFMSNPDEETAAGQFGKGDKYFGVAALMVTLPGLPMFAHGQVEGYAEKYGMEYRRAYHDEQPDEGLIDRHRREIFPLTRKRYLFSEVEHFQLYDFVNGSGEVNDDVIVTSNRRFGERALFYFNNRYEASEGWIGQSVLKVRATADLSTAEERRSVGAALGLSDAPQVFYVLHEHRSGLTFLRSGAELVRGGMYVRLQGYEYQLFEGFFEVVDADGRYRRLADELGGRGVSDLQEAFVTMELRPLHEALRSFVAGESFGTLREALAGDDPDAASVAALEKAFGSVARLLAKGGEVAGASKMAAAAGAIAARCAARRPAPARFSWEPDTADGLDGQRSALKLFLWIVARTAAGTGEGGAAAEASAISALRLSKVVETVYLTGEYRDDQRRDDMALLTLIAMHHDVAARAIAHRSLRGVEEIVESVAAGGFIGTNAHEGIVYYNKERCEELLDWLFFAGACSVLVRTGAPGGDRAIAESLMELLTGMRRLSDSSRYQLREFSRRLQNAPPPSPGAGGEKPEMA